MSGRRSIIRPLSLMLSVGLGWAVAAFGVRPTETGAPEPGSIAGFVTSEAVSEPELLDVTSDNQFCGDQLPSQAKVVNSAGHLRYAVVYLDAVQYDGEPVQSNLRIGNEDCAFVPHVQAGVTGSPLDVTNADPLLHNTHLFLQMGSRNRSLLNLALPNEGIQLDGSRGTRYPGVIEIKCDAHAWMSAYIILFDHPYFAVTDEEGRFTIPNVPPGKYTLKVWHETLGELQESVVVEAGEAATHSFRFAG